MATSISCEAATLWLADNAQLFAIDTTTNEAQIVTPARDIADLAPVRDDLAWILLGRSLNKYSASGALEVVIDLATFDVKDPTRIASNSQDSSVWLTSRSGLYHFASDGSLVNTLTTSELPVAISLASDQTLWVLTSSSLAHFSTAGALIETANVGTSSFDATDRLMIDSTGSRAWIAGRTRLASIDLRNSNPMVETISLNGTAIDFAWDGSRRRVWVAFERSLVGFGDGAVPPMEVGLNELGPQKLSALAIDPADGTLWVGHAKGVSHLDVRGSRLSQPQIAAVPTLVRVGPAAPALRLQLLNPAENETTSSVTPSFLLRVENLCNGVPCMSAAITGSVFSLRAMLDSRDIGKGFKFDALGNAIFTPGEPLLPGTHQFTAIASDNHGHTSNAIGVKFTVSKQAITPSAPEPSTTTTASPSVSPSSASSQPLQAAATHNNPPTVSVTSPSSGATFAGGSNIALNATASDSDGTVAKVEFFRGGTTLIGTATSSPYTITWSNVASGSYSLTAKATDNAGAVTTSTAVNITVTSIPPTVSITAPTSGATFTAPASLAITANATDSAGTIAKVDFLQGTALLGTVTAAPYTFNWSNVAAGSYSLTAKATDNSGSSATSAAVSITVAAPNIAPLVVITQPIACSSLAAPSAVTLTADAYDPDGTVALVSFYKDSTLIGTATNAPYSISWSSPAAGTFSLTAAVTDNRGAKTVSQPISITVAPPNSPPAVTLTSPSSGSSFGIGSTVALAATATDTDGAVTKVEFLAGSTLVGTATTAPYNVNWIPSASGSYALTARATDNASAATTSGPVNVAVLSNSLPTVSITAPTSGATYRAPASITVTATAVDSDGTVARVDFYANQTLIGSASAAPYNITWSSVQAGNYAITAVATDNLGGTKTSASVSISVTPNSPPVVSITSPASGAAFSSGAPIQVTASATDSDGTVTKVEFFQGATLIGRSTVAPYQFTWNNVPGGNYSLIAKATDNDGGVTWSSPVSISVLTNIAPAVIVSSPSNNSTFFAPATILISANAIDSDGTVARVDFYQGSTLVGSSSASPFSATWTNVQAGTYLLTAKAIDNVGAVTTSDAISVNVVGPSLTITAPADNSVLSDDSVIVSGSFGGPLNSGIAINGVVASLDQNNHYFARVPLASGTNTLTATITTPDGRSATSSVTVTSDGVPAPMPAEIVTSDLEGIAPFTATFTVTNPTSGTLVVKANGGSPLTLSNKEVAGLNFAFPSPGVYPFTITVTDAQNVVTSRTYLVVASDAAQMDKIATAVWNSVNDALIAGDKSTAMMSLNPSAQSKYGPVFDTLMPTYSSIASSFSALRRGSLGADYAEYAINRVIDGVNRLFLVYFIKDADGLWQLDSM